MTDNERLRLLFPPTTSGALEYKPDAETAAKLDRIIELLEHLVLAIRRPSAVAGTKIPVAGFGR